MGWPDQLIQAAVHHPGGDAIPARPARGDQTASLIDATGTGILCVPLAAVAVAGAELSGDGATEPPSFFTHSTDRC